jgi:hypothetical protein
MKVLGFLAWLSDANDPSVRSNPGDEHTAITVREGHRRLLGTIGGDPLLELDVLTLPRKGRGEAFERQDHRQIANPSRMEQWI